MNCHECGIIIGEDLVVCKDCGSVQKRVCSKCGNYADAGTKYCAVCRQRLTSLSSLQYEKAFNISPKKMGDFHRCTRCRRHNLLTSNYCFACGLDLGKKVKPASVDLIPEKANESGSDKVAKNEKNSNYFGGFRVRIFAFLVDAVIFGFVSTALLVLPGVEETPMQALFLVLVFSLLYWILVVLVLNGTIGMRLLSLRILRISGKKCGFWQVIARFFVCFLPFSFLIIGPAINIGYPAIFFMLVFILNSIVICIRKDKRGLNDLICGTMVSKKGN